MLKIYQEIVKTTSKGERVALATVISSQGSAPRAGGAKMLVRKDGSIVGTIGGGKVEYDIIKKALDVMNSDEGQVIHYDLSGEKDMAGMICGGQMDIFIEPVIPEETIYLFGAGHISQKVAAIAKQLGFQIVVIDPRAEYNNADRFPDANSLIVEAYASAPSRLSIDPESYIVICTPGHVSDEQCLQFAVGTGAKYIGMIGSRKKVKEVKERLVKKGISEEQLARVNAPIGLDINAETPEEIAISILAEIVKVRRSG